jgi:hypothetical protein
VFLSLLLIWNVLVSLALGAAAYLAYLGQNSPVSTAVATPTDRRTNPYDGQATGDSKTTEKPPPDSQERPKENQERPKDNPKGEKANRPNTNEPEKDKAKRDDNPKDGNKEPPDNPKDGKAKAEPANTPLEKAARALESDDDEEQIAAAEQLAKMGAKAKPASRAVCQALVTASGAKKKQLLETLEKINPGLYEPVVVLLVDRSVENHVAASTKIADRQDGKDALPIVRKHADRFLLQIEQRGSDTYIAPTLVTADVNALKRIGVGDEKVIDLLVRVFKISRTKRRNDEIHRLRFAALDTLKDWCKGQKRKKQLVDLQLDELKAFQQIDPSNFYSEEMEEAFAMMENMAAFGAEGKAVIPVLKELKTHSNAEVRKKAASVLESLAKPAE